MTSSDDVWRDEQSWELDTVHSSRPVTTLLTSFDLDNVGKYFDLAVSALAVHHLGGAGEGDVFARVVARLRPGRRFVPGDVVIPDDPADVVTPIDGVYDEPSTIDDQVRWLAPPACTPKWSGRARTSP